MTSGNEGSAKVAALALLIIILLSSGCASVHKGDVIRCDSVAIITERWIEPSAFSVDGFEYFVNVSDRHMPLKIKRELFPSIPINQTIVYYTGFYGRGEFLDGSQKITINPLNSSETGLRNACRVVT